MTVGVTVDADLEKNSDGIYDFTLDDSEDIKTENSFDTSILMSLFCEKRATDTETPTSHLRRGWIGNESTPGFEIGSKLWLYDQARLNLDTLNGIKSAIKNGLKWMIEDNIAIEVLVAVSLTNSNTMTTTITITRPNSKVERRFFELWENTGK